MSSSWNRFIIGVALLWGAAIHFAVVCCLAYIYGGMKAVYWAGDITAPLLIASTTFSQWYYPSKYTTRNGWSLFGAFLVLLTIGFAGHYLLTVAFISNTLKQRET